MEKTTEKIEYNCYDCGKELEISEDKKIKEGQLLKYKDSQKEYFIFKCNECYQKDKALRKFKECEVYSRVVGYLRPVQNWNPGKVEEFKERKVFKTK